MKKAISSEVAFFCLEFEKDKPCGFIVVHWGRADAEDKCDKN